MKGITKDWIERCVGAVVIAVIAVVIQQVANLEGELVPVLVLALQVLKNVLGQRFGDPATAGFSDTRAG